MINMQILSLKGLDCLELCLINITNYYRNDYTSSFCETFRFLFENKNYNLSDKLSIGDPKICKYIDDYYKIRIESTKRKDMRDIHNITLPCVVKTKTDLCSWLPQYHMQSMIHFFIVIHIDIVNWYIVDPINHNKVVTVNLSSIPQILDDIYFINYDTTYEILPSKYLLEQSILHLYPDEFNTSYIQFMNYINDVPDLSDEYEHHINRLNISKLDKKIGYDIAGSRYLYALFLNNINSQLHNNKIEEIKQQILQSMHLWQELRNILFKAHILKNFSVKRQQYLQHIDNIRCLENRICTNLKLL